MLTFIHYTNNAREAHLTGYTLSQGLKDISYKTTFEAEKYSYVVNNLSSGYLQVSNKFPKNSVSSLGNLLLMESPQETQAAQLTLTNNCKNTVQG